MGLLAALGSIISGGGGGMTGTLGFENGKSTTVSKGTSTTNTSASQTGSSTTNASGTTDSTSMDAASKALLDRFTAAMSDKIGTGGQGFTKADAVNDVAKTIEGIFRQYKEVDLPQIAAVAGQSGAYGSTNTAMLANDAFAESIAKASALTLSTIKDYAGISTANEAAFTNSLLSAFQLQAEAVKKQTESATSASTSKTDSTSTSKTDYLATDKTKSKKTSLGLGFKL